MLSSEKQGTLHLNIGRQMLRFYSPEDQDEFLFEILSQLNTVRDLINDPGERLDLAQLNLKASKRARDKTSYSVSAQCATTAIEFLPKDSWETHYRLTLENY